MLLVGFFVCFTALLDSYCVGVVASQDQRCFKNSNSFCPEPWHHWGSSCYMITESTRSWLKAREECINLGGVLAVPSSIQENDFIVELIPENEAVWIDCNDREVEGTWECQEDNVKVTYSNWGIGEPNDDMRGEDCAVISMMPVNVKRKWNDTKCNLDHRAVCKLIRRPVLHT